MLPKKHFYQTRRERLELASTGFGIQDITNYATGVMYKLFTCQIKKPLRQGLEETCEMHHAFNSLRPLGF